MPEAFIIYRFRYKENLTEEWRAKFHALNGEAHQEAASIIKNNIFTQDVINKASSTEIREVLQYYLYER